MRIAIDGRLINKIQNTGISRYTEFLIEYYLHQFPLDEIILIVNNDKIKYEGLTTVYCANKPFNIIDFLKFTRFIDDLKLDVLHSPFYSGLNRKINGLKNIVTIHDLMYRLVPGFFGKNWLISFMKISYFNFIVKKSLMNAECLISVSQTTCIDVKKNFNLDSHHVPEDSEINSQPDLDIIKKYGLSHKGYYFYCGNNRPHKNLEFVIKIFNNNKKLPPLVLAGKGHECSDNVKAIGIVTDNELHSLYSNAIAFIFPSCYEGFGLPILEALRCRTLVIASNISAFLEFKSSNIYFFKLNDSKQFSSILNLVKDKEYIDEPRFFEYYEKSKIYLLLDKVVSQKGKRL